jgi:hypothetical protein
MDHRYINIHAFIREANRQRSIAIGNLLSEAWIGFGQFLAAQLGRPETPRLTTPAKLAGIHH